MQLFGKRTCSGRDDEKTSKSGARVVGPSAPNREVKHWVHAWEANFGGCLRKSEEGERGPKCGHSRNHTAHIWTTVGAMGRANETSVANSSAESTNIACVASAGAGWPKAQGMMRASGRTAGPKAGPRHSGHLMPGFAGSHRSEHRLAKCQLTPQPELPNRSRAPEPTLP